MICPASDLRTGIAVITRLFRGQKVTTLEMVVFILNSVKLIDGLLVR